MRILVVEDDELIGTAIARALRDAAYVADWVTDAPSATSEPGATATATSAAAVGINPGIGVQFHGMWSSYTDAQRILVLDKLKAAGIKTVRIDVSWTRGGAGSLSQTTLLTNPLQITT